MDDLLLSPVPEDSSLDFTDTTTSTDHEMVDLIINLCSRSYIANAADWMILKHTRRDAMSETMLYIGLPVVQKAIADIDGILTKQVRSVEQYDIPSKEAMSIINRYLIYCMESFPWAKFMLKKLHHHFHSCYRLKCPDCSFSARSVKEWLQHREESKHEITPSDKIVYAILDMQPMAYSVIPNTLILRHLGIVEYLVEGIAKSYEMSEYTYRMYKKQDLIHPYLCGKCHVFHQTFREFHQHTCKSR